MDEQNVISIRPFKINFIRIKTFFLFLALFVVLNKSYGQVYKNPNAPVEDRVEALLSAMTLTEKLEYVGGYNDFYIRGIPRLGLPQIKMSDGPVGVKTFGNATAYPAGICVASTWDIELVQKMGIHLGKDARARGVHILLAPGMNIYRAPMCGRNYEYFGEDPYLAGQIAVAYIKGVQSQRVVCTAKHFAANNQEWDRNNVSSDMDERTLQEIYLPAFKASVLDGKVGSIMNSYNLINGVHATQNTHLNNKILKTQWNFDGFVMSDWVSTYNGLAAAKGGLDIEMPSAVYMSRTNLQSYLNNGSLSEDIIDDKVRRILRIIFRFGFYDNNQTDSSIPLDNSSSAQVSLDVARSGIVLLKNTDSILPLSASNIKTIAVIGPNADIYAAAGGSSYTYPFHSVSILQGIKKIVGDNVKVNYISGASSASDIAKNSLFYTSVSSNVKGLVGEYFNNQSLSNIAKVARTDSVINFKWANAPNVSGLSADHFSIRWTGVMKPDKTGEYEFVVAGDDGFRLWVNNQLIINNWVDEPLTTKKVVLNLNAGVYYPVKLEYYENGGDAEISFGYRINGSTYDDVIKAASSADAAIVCVGFNIGKEGEGFDRTFSLPNDQDSLINVVAKYNSKTVVVLNAGGNVAMTAWVNNIKGLLHAWYPGQEGGTAIAEILFGITNPSGKLPASFEKQWKDNPTFNSYYSNNKKVYYSEGIFLGYRYYDSKNVEPMFPFGFGLSYTSFEYSNLIIVADTVNGNIQYTVSFDVKNNGSVEGEEISQIYIKDIESTLPRPNKELKAFSKVKLAPGETKTVSLTLDKNAFAYYSNQQNSFVVEKGDFEILVGSSSKDIRLSNKVTISDSYIITDISDIKIPTDEISIFPLPAKDILNICTNGFKPKCFVDIYDIGGRKMERFELKTNSQTYNCSKLSDGIYIFRFTSGNSISSKKVIIRKGI